MSSRHDIKTSEGRTAIAVACANATPVPWRLSADCRQVLAGEDIVIARLNALTYDNNGPLLSLAREALPDALIYIEELLQKVDDFRAALAYRES